MLILSRRRDEQIVIGDGIVITVVSVRGSKVQIGIEAPYRVSVRRREPVPAAEVAESDPSDRQEAAADETGGESG